MKNVLIFFGGVSQEHEISIITGVLTANSIDKEKFNPIAVYLSKNGEFFIGEELFNISFFKNVNFKKLKKVCLICGNNKLYQNKNGRLKQLCSISCAINCMHGKNGEDGAICGLLQLCNVPIASPNTFCSSLSINKSLTNLVVGALGVKTCESTLVEKGAFLFSREKEMLKIVDKICFPLIVKPCCSGSSIGISVAKNFSELESSLESAFDFDNFVVCEKYVENAVDINCAVYSKGNEVVVSACEKPITINEILTFKDKYTGAKTGVVKEFPANISIKNALKIQDISAKIYKSLGFFGIVRFDFLLSDDQVYFNEINSVPGSLAYYLFCNKLSDFMGILTGLIEDALSNFNRAEQSVKTLDNGFVLKDIQGVKK